MTPEPEPVRPPSPPFDNFQALALLLDFFRDLSSEPAEGQEIHWNLLERTLRVRFLYQGACIARITVLLDSPLGLEAQGMEFAQHPVASEMGAALLRRVQDTPCLRTLERSLVRGLMHYVTMEELAKGGFS